MKGYKMLNDGELMSDVERICAANHDRVRWADEVYADCEPINDVLEKQKEKSFEKYRALRAATLLAAAVMGIGITFLCIGICDMSLSTILMGAIIFVTFAISGYQFDVWADKELENVCSL